ncbi:MAG: MarR family transcriptional regulator [Candidatus Sphingomonas colombiensis]|nr:MarR family transcriptional regulator [Sphingomonas sp.]WEK43975.1 MAG: MarR family transcriptional regulator [Sphingomonas sp.]
MAKRNRPSAAGKEGNVALGPLKDYIGFQLRRAQDVSFQAFAKRVGEADLSPGHFAILSVIKENPGLNQTALSYATGRDKSTLTPALKSLEKHGFISRERSNVDRRVYHLNLTALGTNYLEKLAVHAEAHDRILDEIVGDFHKPLLIHLLERIVEELGRDSTEDSSSTNNIPR